MSYILGSILQPVVVHCSFPQVEVVLGDDGEHLLVLDVKT